jgi:hypothetical protein
VREVLVDATVEQVQRGVTRSALGVPRLIVRRSPRIFDSSSNVSPIASGDALDGDACRGAAGAAVERGQQAASTNPSKIEHTPAWICAMAAT